MTNVNITIINVVAPTQLGTTIVTLNINQTVNITPAMLMASSPPYSQPQGFSFGSIKIIGTSDPNYKNILDSTHSTSTSIARLKTNSLPIGYPSSTAALINNTITPQVLNSSNGLEVLGVNVGTTNFYYVATAWDGVNTESDFTTYVTGMVTIIVNNPTNNPPSNLSDSYTTCVLGSFKVLDMTVFSNGYSDPEGDPIGTVKITGVVQGTLTLNGLTVTTFPIILTPQQINSGVLIFKPLPNATLSTLPKIEFTVSDTGSGQYY